MKLTRRKMLATVGVAVGSSAFAKLGAAEKDAPEPVRPAATKASDASSSPVCLADFEPLAKQRLPHFVYEYVASGAADELTIRWNREAFDQIRLRPKVLVNVEKIDTRVTLFASNPARAHRAASPFASRWGGCYGARSGRSRGDLCPRHSFDTAASGHHARCDRAAVVSALRPAQGAS
jgi:hypothetical protein